MKPGTLGIIFLVIVFLVFWVKGTVYLDPDLGFRLRTGEIILSDGFPETDPYSYTMPSFPYVEHAWLVATAWALTYPLIGKVGLSLVSSAIAIGAILISVSRVSLKNIWSFGLPPFLLAISVVLPFSGVRAQVFSWLMMSTLLLVVFNARNLKKWRPFLPFFFLLWANLHGSFVAGLSVLFFVLIIRTLRKRKVETKNAVVLALSVLATFINPYGAGAWREALSSVADRSLQWQIAEWMPALLMIDFSFIALSVLSFLLVFRYRKKFKAEEVGIFIVVLLQALLSRRHIPLWVIVAVPMTISGLSFFYQEVRKIKKAIPRFRRVYLFAWVGSLVILIFQSFFSIKNASFLSEERFYPGKAVEFIKANLPSGEIFSKYGWGGYLIWELPEKKVFIDGRMPSWRWRVHPPDESSAAFDEYGSILGGEVNYKKSFDKYGVDTVLWPQNRPISLLRQLSERIAGLLKKPTREFNLLNEIEKDGWEKVYEDSVSFIYKRPT